MMMRYHWSLGIGHTYAYETAAAPPGLPVGIDEADEIDDGVNQTLDLTQGGDPRDEEPDDTEEPDPDSDDPELIMEDRQDEDLGSDNPDDADENFGEDSDDELFETYNM